MRKSAKLFILIASILIACGPAFAGWWWGQETILAPSGSEKVREEKRLIAGSEMTFAYYTNNQSADSVRDFYRRTLANAGWTENEKITGGGNALLFQRGDETITIVFPPARAFRDKLTRFTVAAGKMNVNAGPGNEGDLDTKLLTRPSKDVVPEYPGAALTSLNEGPLFQRTIYSSRDSIDQVTAFYKSNMPLKGWKLVGDGPVENLAMPKARPDQPEINRVTKEMVFANTRGDGCRIVIGQMSFDKNTQPKFGNMTNIVVNYEKKP
jgi:hypothetical protein